MTRRAAVIGLAGTAFFAAFTPYNDIKVGATMIAGNQFPVGALFAELILVGVVNVALRRFYPRLALRPRNCSRSGRSSWWRRASPRAA